MNTPEINRYKTLLEELFRRETEHKLFELQTSDGIRYWDLVRNTVFNQIMGEAGIMPSYHLHAKGHGGSFKKRLKAAFLFPIAVFHKITRKPQNGSVLTLNISRNWSEKDQQLKDLLFSDIHQALGQSCFHLELYTPSQREIIRKRNRNRHYLIDLELRKLWKKNSFKDSVDHISCFDDLLPTNFPIQQIIQDELFHFRIEFGFYQRLLTQKRIRKVFLQSQPKSLIAAAHSLNLPSFDLQHGHINEFDPFYSYSPEFDPSGLPTVIQHYLTVGSYWNQFVHPSIHTVTVGSRYFYPGERNLRARLIILIIGSRFIHESIIHELKACAKELPNEQFIYKLHSNQADQFDETIAFFSDLTNVDVRLFDDVNTLLTHSKWLILVQSTVAYQALQMGIPVCIYKKYYYEASEDLFNREDVVMVDSLQQFSEMTNRIEMTTTTQSVFFEPFRDDILREHLHSNE